MLGLEKDKDQGDKTKVAKSSVLLLAKVKVRIESFFNVFFAATSPSPNLSVSIFHSKPQM